MIRNAQCRQVLAFEVQANCLALPTIGPDRGEADFSANRLPSLHALDSGRMQAVIIGAGIGGLAAAVALRRVGIGSLVVERAESIREVGAGLTIWPNAVNALRELG